MILLLLSLALAQLTPQQKAEQKEARSELDQWVKDHQLELLQRFDRMNRIKALTYDQALIVYDQCLAQAAASLDDELPERIFDRSFAICLPQRAELLDGRPPAWFVGFKELDASKRASFPALTKQLREQLRAHGITPK